MKTFALNAGGTLGMGGKPLAPVKSAKELMEGITIPPGVDVELRDFELREDSTDVFNSDRIQMGQAIESVYENHDTFVVFHGTDSLEDTCAMFCMMYKQSLQKPIFVIGAQRTKDEVASDVPLQIGATFRIAKIFHQLGIVGVYSVCMDDVLHGARIRKKGESKLVAFHTPGRYPVAQAWSRIVLNEGCRKLDPVLELQGLHLDSRFERAVSVYKASADNPPWTLIDAAEAGRTKGVILEAKGSGNIPSRKWSADYHYSWIDAIRIATEKGVHVAILSPFEDGRVDLERYKLGKMAKEAGALSLESLTPAMAEVKFRHAIAMFGSDREKIQRFLSVDILGELLPSYMDIEEDSGDLGVRPAPWVNLKPTQH